MPVRPTNDPQPESPGPDWRFCLAALRYSGGWGESRYRDHEARLLEAVRAAGLTPIGEPIYARYNSPFSLPFLRRNEVLIEVAEPQD